MSVQSEIDRIITAVGNAYSKVSEKGGTVPASQTVANLATAIDSIPAGGSKETWVIKSDASGEFATTQISFTSNGQKYTSIGANSDSSSFIILHYDSNEIAGYDPGAGSYGYEFDNEAYRKLTFDTPPTGALLTWLQSNAVKQPDDTAVQDTKALTITSNGTVSVTPDAPYDGLNSVDVTVNVSGGGGATIPGIVELFTTSGLHYSPEYGQTINITFSAWPNYFGVYCTDGQKQNIFIGPAVYFGDMAKYVNIENQVIINDVNFNDGVVVMQTYEYVNYYFLSDVEMTINTQ